MGKALMVEIVPETAGLPDWNGTTAVSSLQKEQHRVMNVSKCHCMLALKMMP